MSTARENNAHRATFTHQALQYPFGEGSFRYVAKGRYTMGRRNGQACVAKWFKNGSVFEESYYENDLKLFRKAYTIVDRFNSLGLIDKVVRVNKPEVWTWSDDSSGEIAIPGAKHITEPFIQNYQKFNSNTGWSNDAGSWPQVMQALSHFSYHTTGGHQLLCDLQGGVYRDSLVLSDPVILSRTTGGYGPTDLGSQGISSFFHSHECNAYCSSSWMQPRYTQRAWNPRMGTTMHRVETAHSRPASTRHFY